MYWLGSTIARALSPAATNKESIATGPTASCLEVPKNAYTICGVKAAYRPYIGGNPAINAYAIP